MSRHGRDASWMWAVGRLFLITAMWWALLASTSQEMFALTRVRGVEMTTVPVACEETGEVLQGAAGRIDALGPPPLARS